MFRERTRILSGSILLDATVVRSPCEFKSMKRRKVTPVGKRSKTPSVRSEQPAKLKDFVEDPLPEKRDMKAEQKAAFRQPGDPDSRVKASESDQGRTR